MANDARITGVTRELVMDLVGARRPPCVSLFMPVEKKNPDRRRNPLVYRQLLKEVDESLASRYPDSRKELMGRLDGLADDDLWRERRNGFAVFASSDRLSCHDLPGVDAPLAVVGASFHTRPLLRHLGVSRNYFVVAITQRFVALFEGDRETIRRVDEVKLPSTIAEVVPAADLDRSNVHYHRGRSQDSSPIYHSPGEEKAQPEAELEKFFHAIDERVFAFLNRQGRRDPVFLATRARYAPIYRRVTRVGSLHRETIVCDAEATPESEIGRRAWELTQTGWSNHCNACLERFDEARSKGRGTSVLAEAARAAAGGRVELLLVDETRQVWGELDPASGEVSRVSNDGHRDPGGEDLLDDLAGLVVARGGEVIYVHPDRHRVPGESGVAAIFRY